MTHTLMRTRNLVLAAVLMTALFVGGVIGAQSSSADVRIPAPTDTFTYFSPTISLPTTEFKMFRPVKHRYHIQCIKKHKHARKCYRQYRLYR